MTTTVTAAAGMAGRPSFASGGDAETLDAASGFGAPGGGFGATSCAAPATTLTGCAVPSCAASDADTSEPSGWNAMASPCASFGSGTRTGFSASAATTSPSFTGNRYASV